MPAEVKILVEGYTNADSVAQTGEEKTCPTITLVRDGDLVMVVDPGVLESQQILIDALQEQGLTLSDVNVICITHSHIDHYRNIGMFQKAKTLEYFGLWDEDKVEDWQEQFSENIQVLRTPGHDYTGITLFVSTEQGLVAICGDVFWKEDYPKDDMYATDSEKLNQSRQMVLKMAQWIIPGHGPMYKGGGAGQTELQKTIISAKNKDLKFFAICKKCQGIIKNRRDRCICQPAFCYHCCQCDIDCDSCSCKHRK